MGNVLGGARGQRISIRLMLDTPGARVTTGIVAPPPDCSRAWTSLYRCGARTIERITVNNKSPNAPIDRTAILWPTNPYLMIAAPVPGRCLSQGERDNMRTHPVCSFTTSGDVPGEGLATRPLLSHELVVTQPIDISSLTLQEEEPS